MGGSSEDRHNLEFVDFFKKIDSSVLLVNQDCDWQQD